MRDARTTGATLLALGVGLLWPSLSRAKEHESATKQTHSATKVASKAASKRSVHKAGVTKSSQASPATARRPTKRKATRIIRQDEENRVVLDWIQTVRPPRIYGPFLPVAELFDYPQPPCQPVDVVLEARLHDEGTDAPEAATAEESSDPQGADRQSRIARLVTAARQIGFFLHPKSASARVQADDADLATLLSANLRIPVEGVDVEKLRDSFLDRRGRYRTHLAIDIGAPRGTPVLATADGEIVRLRREKQGGITIYQKDPSGKYLFFYCHLSRYARGLAVGQQVAAGDVIGYVGSTGHVIGGPHLHFSITRVPEDDDFREGLAINPYLLFLAGVP